MSMNTFSSLNTSGDAIISFTDNRNYGVNFVWPKSENLNFTLDGNTFTAQRSNDIAEIVRPTLAQVEYEIDVSAVSGATVSWSTVPSGCTVLSGSGVYTMVGIDSVEDWQTVRAPTITVPTTFEGSFFYTSTIRYQTTQGQQEESWQVGNFLPIANLPTQATVTATARNIAGTTKTLRAYFNLTAELDRAGFSGPSTYNFLVSNTATITGNPTIVYGDGDGTEIWTITVTPSTTTIIDTISTSGTGGTSSFNGTSKVLTLTGTEAQVESHLNSMSLTTTSTESDAYFTYAGSNTDNPSITYTVRQTLNCLNLDYLTEPRGSATYTSGVASTIGLAGPQIYDIDYTGSGTYTLTVTPTTPTQIQNISSTGITRWGSEQEYEYTASSTGFLNEAVYGSSNNVMVVSNPGDDTNATDAGGIHWFIKTDLEYANVKDYFASNANAQYGDRMAMADDDTLIVSGWGYYTSNINDPIGRVLVFERGVGNTWSLAQTITPPDGAQDSWFGYQLSCSRDGDTLAIAEPTDTQTGENREGRVHIYTRTGTGDYTRQTTILDPDTDYNSSFAWTQCRLSPDGTRLIVTDGLSDSDTYVYTGAGASWSLDEEYATKRIAYFTSDGTRYLYSDGTSIYVMQRQSGGSWTQQSSFTPSSTHYADSLRLSLDDSTVIVKLVNSSTDFEFIIIDFDESTNNFTESRTIDLGTEANLTTIYGYQLNLDGTEIVGIGEITGGNKGYVTYTYAPKPGDFNTTTKVFTIFGTKAEVNADIDTIAITSNSITNIELTYDLTTPEANTEDKVVTVTNTG